MLNLKNKSNLFFDRLSSYDSDYLQVSYGHRIYYEQYGNPKGIPILFLHGGPGAGFSNSHKSFFDPNIFRVIFFDQRGSGKSTPYAETKHNNTQLLIFDIENLRKLLKIDKWYLFGGSWGSTLALLYGIDYPSRCLGFVLRGIFLGTKTEIDWFLYGIKKFFPEAYNNSHPLFQKTSKKIFLDGFMLNYTVIIDHKTLKLHPFGQNMKTLVHPLIMYHVQFLVNKPLQYQK